MDKKVRDGVYFHLNSREVFIFSAMYANRQCSLPFFVAWYSDLLRTIRRSKVAQLR